MNFKNQLAHIQVKCEIALERIMPPAQGRHGPVIEAMRYATLGGGKRLRPFLLVETARLFGDVSETVWDAAAALECIHVYSLIHDDLPCMDDDDLRRGKPTVHIAFDEALAVLAGDALQTLTFETLSNLECSTEIKLALVKLYAMRSGHAGMVGGQVIDILAPEAERSETLIRELQEMKTGALLSCAVEAGAILGGASLQQTDHLKAFAKALGLAFQIKDDILDVEGDPDLLGKATGKDADLGKATFVSIMGLESAREYANNLGDEAKSHLKRVVSEENILHHIVDYVLNRKL